MLNNKSTLKSILILILYFFTEKCNGLNNYHNKNSYKYYNNYPYNKEIHNLGNTGFTGKIHAHIAKPFTKLIDIFSYNGRNIREEIINNIPKNNTILDLCCGVGISTSSNPNCLGIDSSPEMIFQAKKNYPDKNFEFNNAEYFIPNSSNNIFNYATCFFAFHEMPPYAWSKIIKNTETFITNKIIIMDISPNYKPSKTMLTGEPYLLEYQKQIQNILKKHKFEENTLIENRVTIWEKYL
jgi:SAM-dependent methyltransferase